MINYQSCITIPFSENQQKRFQIDLDDHFQDFFGRILADNLYNKAVLSALQHAFLSMTPVDNGKTIITLSREERSILSDAIADHFQTVFRTIISNMSRDCDVCGMYEQETAETLLYSLSFCKERIVPANVPASIIGVFADELMQS